MCWKCSQCLNRTPVLVLCTPPPAPAPSIFGSAFPTWYRGDEEARDFWSWARVLQEGSAFTNTNSNYYIVKPRANIKFIIRLQMSIVAVFSMEYRGRVIRYSFSSAQVFNLICAYVFNFYYRPDLFVREIRSPSVV